MSPSHPNSFQESAFAFSDDRVVASLAVLKKSFSTGVGSVAKRFVRVPFTLSFRAVRDVLSEPSF